MAKLFLGLDSSTQSLSAVVIDLDAQKVIYEKSVNFDKDLPQFKTQNGVLPNRDPLVKHSNPLLWAAALDLLFTQMKKDKVALGKILAISGSGQQHGSVYLNERMETVLAALDPKKSLVENLEGIFARKTSPVWMDSSTAKECAEIRKKLGGVKYTASRTGSDTFERFTGPQIRKFFKTEKTAFEKTAHIALVSSFMASLLAGKIAPIDFGDGAGTNLMDIRKKNWNHEAVKATAPGLMGKLPPLADAGKVIGPVSSYFVGKYGLNAEALATVWTGDNPASVVGLGLVKAGEFAISLGTSDTFFGTMQDCHTDEMGEGHVFGSPAGGYMTLICFKNGSLAREKIRELYKIADWKKFGELVTQTAAGNNRSILLPWFDAEIVPRVNRPGIHRFDLDEKDVAANCRAVFEAQAMSMRLHSQWMGITPQKILATGGAANDRVLLQIIADVMQCNVERIEVSKSAALGAALIAAHGFLTSTGKNPKWEKITDGFCRPVAKSEIKPDRKAAKTYDSLLDKYAGCEADMLDVA
ncbi:MAG TPA: FGGY-family carbohydrate kinase [Candidatus Sulfotelmatobacter sp.]|jgi:xylulokinase|nr:FGGY-family carbohydrate kinase [Candidatus Sulfotelmatobacter sp.]